jgi:F-type H+-transporting ATPase subunit gamma
MSRITEIKEQQGVVNAVGSFASSLQQISAARMAKLRTSVVAAQRFVQEAALILRELQLEKAKEIEREKQAIASQKLTGKLKKKQKVITPVEKPKRTAIIVITSNQGLCGSYNTDIAKKMNNIVNDYPDVDYFIIGKKGQEFFRSLAKKYNTKFYPFNIPELVEMRHLKPLIGMFYYYDQIFLVYSKYINTTNREVVFIELAVPHNAEAETTKEKEEGKFIFEPSLDEVIKTTTAKLRSALFRQQILDSRLSLYASQMIAMQTASDNAKNLTGELQIQYNKARRKLIDKKIQEVQAGRSLWDKTG